MVFGKLTGHPSKQMDPALLQEREKFKKRALANPVIEKRNEKIKSNAVSTRTPPKPYASSNLNNQGSNGSSLGALTLASQHKFSVLAKIVKHLRERFLKGYMDSLTLEDILEEMRLIDVNYKIKQWLDNEALKNNPKIKVEDNRYIFKQPYAINDKKSLLKLLAHHDENGLGGILLEDIEESLPNSEKVLKQVEDDIIIITRAGDKKKVVFHDDPSCKFEVNPDFVKLWRSIPMENIDDAKIEEYLKNKGISAMQSDKGPINKSKAEQKRRKTSRKTAKPAMKDNEHMLGMLEDYSVGDKPFTKAFKPE